MANDSDDLTRTNVIIAKALLSKVDDSAIPDLVAALGSGQGSTEDAAKAALKRIGKKSPQKVVSALSDALKSHKETSITKALSVLGEIKGHGEQVAAQIAAIYDKVDPGKRKIVLQTLVDLDPKGVHAPQLCIRALEDSDPGTRKAALLGIMRYKSRLEGSLGPIIESLKDQNEDNRLLAISVVKGFGNKAADAVPSLIALATEGTPRVRVSAFSSFGVFTPLSEDAVRVLEKGIGDGDETVKMAALSILRNLGQRNPSVFIPILEKALEAEQDERTKRVIVGTLDSLKKTSQDTGNR